MASYFFNPKDNMRFMTQISTKIHIALTTKPQNISLSETVPTRISTGNDIEYLKTTKIKNLFLGHCTEHLNLFKELPDYRFKEIYPGFTLDL